MGNLPIPDIFAKIPRVDNIIVCPECNQIAKLYLSKEKKISDRKIRFLCCSNKEYTIEDYLTSIINKSPIKTRNKLINPFPTIEDQREFEKLLLFFLQLKERIDEAEKVNKYEYNLYKIYTYLISNVVFGEGLEIQLLNAFNNCVFDFFKNDFGKSAEDIIKGINKKNEWELDFTSNVNIIQINKRFFAFCEGRKCTFINIDLNDFNNYIIGDQKQNKNNLKVINDTGFDQVKNIIKIGNKDYFAILGYNGNIHFFDNFTYDSKLFHINDEKYVHILLIKTTKKNSFITISNNLVKKFSIISIWIFNEVNNYSVVSSEDCAIQSINGNLIIGFEDFKIRIFSIETLQNISYLNLYKMKPLKIIEVDNNSILISIINKGVIKVFLDSFDNDYCYLEGSEKENKKMCLVGNHLCIMDKNQVNIIGINIKKIAWTLEFENKNIGNFDIYDIGPNQFIIKTSLNDKEINIKHFNIQYDDSKLEKIINISNEEKKDDEDDKNDNECNEINVRKSFFGIKTSSKLGLNNKINKRININSPPIIFKGNINSLTEKKIIFCEPDFVHNLLIFQNHLLTSLSNKVTLFEMKRYEKVFDNKLSEEEIVSIIKIDENNIALVLFHGCKIINLYYSSAKKFNYNIIQNIVYDEGFYNGLLLSNDNLFFGTYDGNFLFYKLNNYNINKIVSNSNLYEKIYEFNNIQNVSDMQSPGFLDLKNGKLVTWMIDDKIMKIINYESLEIIKIIKDYPIYDGCLINEKYAILKISENEKEGESNLLTLLFDIENLIITQKFDSSDFEYGVVWINRNKYISFNEEEIICYNIEEKNSIYNHFLSSKKKIVNSFNEKIRHILIWNESLLLIVRNNETISVFAT